MAKSAFTYKGRPYSFAKVVQQYKRLKKQLPAELGTIAVNFFKDSFRRQGWRDRSFEAWIKRKNDKRGKGRNILVKSGRMRNAFRLGQATFDKTEIVNETPYAIVHNEGFKGTVKVKSHSRNKSKVHKVRSSNIKTRKSSSRKKRLVTGTSKVKAHSRKMNVPKRQLAGNSYVMELKFVKHIDNRILSVFEQ